MTSTSAGRSSRAEPRPSECGDSHERRRGAQPARAERSHQEGAGALVGNPTSRWPMGLARVRARAVGNHRSRLPWRHVCGVCGGHRGGPARRAPQRPASNGFGRTFPPTIQAQHLYNRTWALLASTRLNQVRHRCAARRADRRARPGAARRRRLVARGDGPVAVEQDRAAREVARRSRRVAPDPVRRLRHRSRGLHVEAGGRGPRPRRDPQGHSMVGDEPARGRPCPTCPAADGRRTRSTTTASTAARRASRGGGCSCPIRRRRSPSSHWPTTRDSAL